uniref:Uncharacterized protein n=1 Tax=Dromaius novaehollandiae TaxID=8790 RepID=A0A8C4IY21_DRONO
MAFESLFSKPPNPVLDPNMPDSDRQHAGDEREDGELEDGEIDDAAFEDVKEHGTKGEDKQKNDKGHRKSRKKRKKEKEKKKSKRRRRDKHKHNSPSSDDSSDYSHDSDIERTERPHKKSSSSYRDYDSSFSQHGHLSGNYMTSQKMQHKKNIKSKDYDEYGHYSDENFGNYNEEEKDEDFADQLKQYRQSKETSNPDLGPPFPKEPVKKQGMKGIQKGISQRGNNYHVGRGRGMQKKLKRKDRGRGRGGNKGSDGFHENMPCHPAKSPKLWGRVETKRQLQAGPSRARRQKTKSWAPGYSKIMNSATQMLSSLVCWVKCQNSLAAQLSPWDLNDTVGAFQPS